MAQDARNVLLVPDGTCAESSGPPRTSTGVPISVGLEIVKYQEFRERARKNLVGVLLGYSS